jgi:hypothetical protein
MWVSPHRLELFFFFYHTTSTVMHFHHAAVPYPQPKVSCNIPLGVIVANDEEAFRMISECLCCT